MDEQERDLKEKQEIEDAHATFIERMNSAESDDVELTLDKPMTPEEVMHALNAMMKKVQEEKNKSGP